LIKEPDCGNILVAFRLFCIKEKADVKGKTERYRFSPVRVKLARNLHKIGVNLRNKIQEKPVNSGMEEIK